MHTHVEQEFPAKEQVKLWAVKEALLRAASCTTSGLQRFIRFHLTALGRFHLTALAALDRPDCSFHLAACWLCPREIRAQHSVAIGPDEHVFQYNVLAEHDLKSGFVQPFDDCTVTARRTWGGISLGSPRGSVRSACAVRARCKSHVHSPLSPSRPCVAGWVRAECAPKDGGVGRSVLHHAAWAGDLSIFQSLVEAGADVSRQRNTAWRPNGGVRGRGATPLHHAVMYNRRQIVDYMLNTLGVPVDLPGEQGCTGLVNVPSWRRRSLLPRPPRTRGLGSGLLHASRSSAQATET